MGRTFSAVHLLVIISERDRKADKEILRNPATDSAPNRIDVGADVVGKRMACSQVETSGAKSSSEEGSEIERGRIIGSGRKKRRSRRARSDEKKRNDGSQEAGQLRANFCNVP